MPPSNVSSSSTGRLLNAMQSQQPQPQQAQPQPPVRGRGAAPVMDALNKARVAAGIAQPASSTATTPLPQEDVSAQPAQPPTPKGGANQ